MIKMLRRLFLTLLFLSASTPAIFAQNEQATSKSPIDILGTVADHDNLDTPFGAIYLPRIFYWKNVAGESQFDIFKSSASAVASGLFEEVEHVVSPVNGHIIVDLSITSHLFFFWLSLTCVLLLTLYVRSLYIAGTGRTSEPKGLVQNLFEVLFVFIRDDVAKPNIDDRKYARYVPYLFTVFMAIAFMNVFGLLPWSSTATADITVTAALAVCTFVITQFSGTKNYWGHVFWFPGVPVGVKLLMIPVEIIGLFTKPFALAIRLFANMMSGKIMIIAILGLIFIFNDLFGSAAAYGISIFSVILTSVLYILKLFVSLLQAYIFTLLSAVFIGMAAESEELDEEHYYVEHTA